ncbi:unnamed protein product [Gadus morhua 'NCC']
MEVMFGDRSTSSEKGPLSLSAVVESTSKLLLQRHMCGLPLHPDSPTADSQSPAERSRSTEEAGDDTCLGSSSHSGHSCSCPR